MLNFTHVCQKNVIWHFFILFGNILFYKTTFYKILILEKIDWFFVFPHLKDIPFDLSDVTDDTDVPDVPNVTFVNIVTTPAEFC
jgi:hypothetical protein